MKKLWTAFYMSLKMFSALPLPQGRWEEDLRKHSTACLPLVGLALGGLWWGLAVLARRLLPAALAGALIAALPFLLTGFIHLDGFMDTSDAMLSWRDREARLRILKDVHVGAFAVIALALLLLFQFAACLSLERLFPLMLLPVLSRSGSALCVLLLKPLGHSEYATAANVPRGFALAVGAEALLALIALGAFGGWSALLAGAAAIAGYGLSMRWCVRTLGGVSGDLCGFALTVSEFCGLIALSIV